MEICLTRHERTAGGKHRARQRRLRPGAGARGGGEIIASGPSLEEALVSIGRPSRENQMHLAPVTFVHRMHVWLSVSTMQVGL